MRNRSHRKQKRHNNNTGKKVFYVVCYQPLTRCAVWGGNGRGLPAWCVQIGWKWAGPTSMVRSNPNRKLTSSPTSHVLNPSLFEPWICIDLRDPYLSLAAPDVLGVAVHD